MIKILTLFITLQSAIAFGALSYEIELQMGDTSCDGHCLKEIKILKSNLSTKQIRKAYQDATNILGFDFINVVAVDYEDSAIKRNRCFTANWIQKSRYLENYRITFFAKEL